MRFWIPAALLLFGLACVSSEDMDRLNVSTEAVQGIGFPEMVRHQLAVSAILNADPNVLGFSSSVSMGVSGGALLRKYLTSSGSWALIATSK